MRLNVLTLCHKSLFFVINLFISKNNSYFCDRIKKIFYLKKLTEFLL